MLVVMHFVFHGFKLDAVIRPHLMHFIDAAYC